MSIKGEYLRLGELLVHEGLISSGQLEKVIAVQKQEGGRLGEVLVKLGLVKEEQIVAVLGKQLGIPYFSLGKGMLKPAVFAASLQTISSIATSVFGFSAKNSTSLSPSSPDDRICLGESGFP